MEKTQEQKLRYLKESLKQYWWSYGLQLACFPYRLYVHEKVHRRLVKWSRKDYM